VLAPVTFLLLALLTACLVAYGTDASWASVNGGIEFIYLMRRLQWPLVAASLVFCVALIGLVVAGKRRAWWLIGLAPVLALFVHQFATGSIAGWTVVEDPPFVDAREAVSVVGDEDYVVGLVFGETAFAYPYASLFTSPVVLQSDREKRLLLIWSAYANKATALITDRSINARDLDLVSSPANALVVYNTRYGQFINGITGRTEKNEKPAGVKSKVQAYKLLWRQWRTVYPSTKVMLPSGAKGPSSPIAPAYPMPRDAGAPTDTKMITLVATTQPAAVAQADLTRPVPVNFIAGSARVLLLPAALTGVPVAFDRSVKGDLFPAFNVVTPDEKRGTMLIDADSQSLWTLTGKATTGPLKGEQLKPIAVEDHLDLRVMKFWMKDLTIVTPESPPAIRPQGKPGPEGVKPRRRARSAG
jgi:hypothetical protein